MLREEPTREELEMVVRDQENVIRATLDAQIEQGLMLIAAKKQRNRAIRALLDLLTATRVRKGWKATMLTDAEAWSEAHDEYFDLMEEVTANE